MWIAVYNVLLHYEMVTKEKGSLKLFAELMAESWFAAVKPLCDYDSLKNTKEDLRKKDFTEWNKTLYYSYYKVADKLRDYLKKAQLIND